MTNLRIVLFLVVLAVGIASWMLTCAAWQFDEVAAGVIPLDDRAFEELTVVTLGTGGAYENHRRRGPASAIGLGSELILVDAGRGIAESLRAAKIPVSQPGTVLLTNLLPENTLGLDDLLAMSRMRGRSASIRLIGPPGTEALARSVEAATRTGMETWGRALAPGEPPRFEVSEATIGAGDGPAFAVTFAGLEVVAAWLPGGPTEALAYRLTANDRSAVVSGTGWGADALAAFARGAQLLVHDGAMIPTPEEAAKLGLEEDPEHLRREAALHTSLEQAGGIAQRAGVDVLVLVRLRPPPVYDLQVTSLVSDHFDGRVVIAEDGDEFTP